MMIPGVRDEQRIARLQLGGQRGVERLGEPRVFVEVGRGHVNHADRNARRGELQRPEIKIADLVGREHSESPPPGDDHRDILVGIVVGRDLRRIADPQARCRAVRDVVQRMALGETGDDAFGDNALRGQRTGPGLVRLLPQRGEQRGQARACPGEVQGQAVGRVVKAAFELGIGAGS